MKFVIGLFINSKALPNAVWRIAINILVHPRQTITKTPQMPMYSQSTQLREGAISEFFELHSTSAALLHMGGVVRWSDNQRSVT